MTLYKKVNNKIKSDGAVCLLFLCVTFFLFSSAFLLLLYPQTAVIGVKKGIATCINSVIPSLFPFLVISAMAYDIGIFDYISVKAEKLVNYLFRLPSIAFPIIIMSVLGGFPVGASLIEKAVDSEQLTRPQAQRMLMFCVNPGPAFAVSAVGYNMLGSEKAGWIIYAAITLSALLTGIMSRFLDNKTELSTYKNVKLPFSKLTAGVLTETISNSIKNMVKICAWVVIFSCFGKLFELLPLNVKTVAFFNMISEVTNGTEIAAERFTLPVIAAVISFSGLCVHFQILPCILKTGLKYKYFLAVRILSAALSCSLTLLLEKLFPQYTQVVYLGTKPDNASLGSSPFVCVCLMLLCGLFILGDNYVLKKKADKTSV